MSNHIRIENDIHRALRALKYRKNDKVSIQGLADSILRKSLKKELEQLKSEDDGN